MYQVRGWPFDAREWHRDEAEQKVQGDHGQQSRLQYRAELLNRDFHANEPNQKWGGYISYVWTRESWSRLAVILYLHFRRAIGWAVSNRMKRDLAVQALDMAIVSV